MEGGGIGLFSFLIFAFLGQTSMEKTVPVRSLGQSLHQGGGLFITSCKRTIVMILPFWIILVSRPINENKHLKAHI